MLVRSQVFRELGGLDEALLNTREHLDFCLTVRGGGGEVWFEPNAVVTYLPPPPFLLSDIPFYLLRWSDGWSESTLHHFYQKWNLEKNNAELTNSWLAPHRRVAFGKMPGLLRRIAGRRLGNRLMDVVGSSIARQALRKGHRSRTRTPDSDPQTFRV
jgi:hypothetical protein